LRRFFPNIFCSHYFALFCDDFFPTLFACTIGVFLEKLFRAFLLPFFGHGIRVYIKNVFSQYFATIFFPTFFGCTIGVFLETLFHAFFSPFFGHDIRVNVKNVLLQYFATIFFTTFFGWHYWCVSRKIVSRIFFHHFLVTIFVFK